MSKIRLSYYCNRLIFRILIYFVTPVLIYLILKLFYGLLYKFNGYINSFLNMPFFANINTVDIISWLLTIVFGLDITLSLGVTLTVSRYDNDSEANKKNNEIFFYKYPPQKALILQYFFFIVTLFCCLLELMVLAFILVLVLLFITMFTIIRVFDKSSGVEESSKALADTIHDN